MVEEEVEATESETRQTEEEEARNNGRWQLEFKLTACSELDSLDGQQSSKSSGELSGRL